MELSKELYQETQLELEQVWGIASHGDWLVEMRCSRLHYHS